MKTRLYVVVLALALNAMGVAADATVTYVEGGAFEMVDGGMTPIEFGQVIASGRSISLDPDGFVELATASGKVRLSGPGTHEIASLEASTQRSRQVWPLLPVTNRLRTLVRSDPGSFTSVPAGARGRVANSGRADGKNESGNGTPGSEAPGADGRVAPAPVSRALDDIESGMTEDAYLRLIRAYRAEQETGVPDPLYPFTLAIAAQQLDRNGDALFWLRQGDPATDSELYAARQILAAQLMIAEREYDAAIRTIEELAAAWPADAARSDVQLLLGLAYLESGQTHQARAVLIRIKDEPEASVAVQLISQTGN